jgi:hypothetical protein
METQKGFLCRNSYETGVPNFYSDDFRRKFFEQIGALLSENVLPSKRNFFEMPYSTYLKAAFRINYNFIRNIYSEVT